MKKSNIVLTGHDEMVKTGNTGILAVKVEKKILGYWAPNLTEIQVEFLLGEDLLGSGITDSQGIARLKYAPDRVGVHKINYRLPAIARRYRCRPGHLFSVSGMRPAVAVDIDGTLSDYPEWKVPFGGGSAPAFHYAGEFLRRLAARYEIVYLTARDDVLDEVTMSFLKKHGFPEAPVLYNDWRRFLTRAEQFKYESIGRLRENGVPIVAGIGDSLKDVKACHDAGIDAYIRRSDKTVGWGAGEALSAILFQDYNDLHRIFLEKDPHYQSLIRSMQ